VGVCNLIEKLQNVYKMKQNAFFLNLKKNEKKKKALQKKNALPF
jgi:hypothetical protein